jgi:hypothetical protein
MGKKLLYVHVTILLTAFFVGVWAIWEDGMVPEGKNFPNITSVSMGLLMIGQVAGIMAYLKQKNKKV